MKTQASSRNRRGWAGGGVLLLVAAGWMVSLGGVSTRAAAEVRSATQVENPSSAWSGSYRIADADRDVLDLQLD